jgi:glycosyltransferase involved in cell wall biosynthesis
MKIAVVYPFFAHYRAPIIKELLSSKEHEFYFISDNQPNRSYGSLKLYDFEEKDRFIRVKNIWIFKFFLWQKELTKILLSNNFDCVIYLADWKYISTWISISSLKKKGIPTLFWSHGILHRDNSLNNKLKLLFLKQFSNGGFLYSNLAKSILTERRLTKKMSVIFNSLDFRSQCQIYEKVRATNSNAAPTTCRNLVFTGRLIKNRNLELLFHAVKILKDEDFSVSATIIGGGEYTSNLKSLVLDLDLGANVNFVGPLYDENLICRIFENAAVCVFPGPIGLSLIHAFTYRVPVITNDAIQKHKPEFEAFVDGKNGLLFKDGDANSLASAIRKMLSLDTSELDKFRENAFEVVKTKYNPQNQAEIILDHLKTIHE